MLPSLGQDCRLSVRRTFLDISHIATPRLLRSLSEGDLPRNHLAEEALAGKSESSGKISGDVGGRGAVGSSESTGSAPTPVTLPDKPQQCSDGGCSSEDCWPPPDAEKPRPTAAARRRARRNRIARAMTQGTPQQGAPQTSADDQAIPAHGADSGAQSFVPEAATAAGGDEPPDCKPSRFARPAPSSGRQSSVWTEALLANAFEGVASVERVLEAAHQDIEHLSIQHAAFTLHHLGKCVDRSVACDDVEWQAAEPRFAAVLARVRELAAELFEAPLVTQVVWSLGKLGAGGGDTVGILELLAENLPCAALGDFTASELSNVLWGLARLADRSACCRPPAKKLARQVVLQSVQRFSSLTPHCLANGIWAVAKLRLAAVGVTGGFAKSCLAEMCREGCMSRFSPQSLANTLWAVARLQLDVGEVSALCKAVAREIDPERLSSFAPHDLSMAMWALAKMIRKGLRFSMLDMQEVDTSVGCRGAAVGQEVESMLLAFTEEALRRISELSPQGLTNVGWALTTLELTGHECAQRFLGAAADKAMAEPQRFRPEAIADLCWASECCRVSRMGMGAYAYEN